MVVFYSYILIIINMLVYHSLQEPKIIHFIPFLTLLMVKSYYHHFFKPTFIFLMWCKLFFNISFPETNAETCSARSRLSQISTLVA